MIEIKKVVFKNRAPFTNCVSEINNTQVDDAHVIDIVMPRYNLIEYSDIDLETSGNLWQYRGEPALNNNNIIDFPPDNNNSISFKCLKKIAGQIGNDDTKDVEIMVPLKYLSNFWKTP